MLILLAYKIIPLSNYEQYDTNHQREGSTHHIQGVPAPQKGYQISEEGLRYLTCTDVRLDGEMDRMPILGQRASRALQSFPRLPRNIAPEGVASLPQIGD